MGLFDNIKNQLGSQFIEIIEWLDESGDTMVYRFPVYNQEIKMGAQLTVRENQVALFVNEGKAADLFPPGRWELKTENMPIMTTLRGWKYGFQSPFKAEVYFFNTRLFTDLKWGTTNPVMMRDAEFGMIRMRAFGTYAMRIKDARVFFQNIVGTQGLTTTDDIIGQFRSTILSRLSDAIAEAKIPALDLASNYDELSKVAKERIGPEFESFGVELARFFIENISLPEEVEAAIDQRSRIGVLGGHMNQYAQMQAADAIKVAAGNPGGMAGAGVGMGAGVAMGQMMGQAMGSGSASPMAPPPPPAAGASGGTKWSLAIDGKTYGPYSEDRVRQMISSGEVNASVMAWKPGAAQWSELSSFSEFAGSSDVPPPPPPPKS
jgi:membrane protease subunit (stomatin/prohibitin family)